ncbi:hypothetical protein NL676_019668 [Syzygium grande]|nr:hypothetical protein NL676_019668 [Syzygium grande]
MAYPSFKNSTAVMTLKHKKDTWSAVNQVSGDQGKLSQGWFVFARATSLCEGDVCVFELTNQSPTVLEILIFRSSDYT